MEDIPLEQLYITIFNDEDLDQFIDDGELYEIMLKLN
jgi:hypothetical protein